MAQLDKVAANRSIATRGSAWRRDRPVGLISGRIIVFDASNNIRSSGKTIVLSHGGFCRDCGRMTCSAVNSILNIAPSQGEAIERQRCHGWQKEPGAPPFSRSIRLVEKDFRFACTRTPLEVVDRSPLRPALPTERWEDTERSGASIRRRDGEGSKVIGKRQEYDG